MLNLRLGSLRLTEIPGYLLFRKNMNEQALNGCMRIPSDLMIPS